MQSRTCKHIQSQADTIEGGQTCTCVRHSTVFLHQCYSYNLSFKYRHFQAFIILSILQWDCAVFCGHYYVEGRNDRLLISVSLQTQLLHLLIENLWITNWCLQGLELKPAFLSEITAILEGMIIYICLITLFIDE